MARSGNEATLAGIKRELECNGEPIEILPIADLHIGDRYSNDALIARIIDSVKTRPNRYAVLVGDLMNTAIAGSKSDSYAETLTPQEQLEKCQKMLEPIRDRILAIVPGNHEERIARQVGVDMPRILAKTLQLEEVYNDTAALLFLKFGRTKHARAVYYTIYVNHGHGGGRRPGGKLNSLHDYALIVDADCYIVGHTHMPASYKSQTYRVSPQRGVAVLREQLFVNTASALGYGGYGRRGGYAPASNSYPVITLDNTEHHMTVTL